MIGVGKGGGSGSKVDESPAWATNATEALSPDIIRASVALWGSDFDRALLSFAEKRGIVASGAQWKVQVLIAAGLEHPELTTTNPGGWPAKAKRRGRPRKQVNRLLAVAEPKDGESVKMVAMLATVNAEREAAGLRKFTDTEFAQAITKERGNYANEQAFVSAVQTVRNRLSAARKATLQPLKPRKSPK